MSVVETGTAVELGDDKAKVKAVPDAFSSFDTVLWTLRWLYNNEFDSTVKCVVEIFLMVAWTGGQPFLIMSLFSSEDSDGAGEDFLRSDQFVELVYLTLVLAIGEAMSAQLSYMLANDCPSGGGFVPVMQKKLAKHVLNTQFEYLETVSSTALMSTLETHIYVVNSNIDAVLQLFRTVLELCMLFIVVFLLSWHLTMLVLFFLPSYIIYNHMMGKGVTSSVDNFREAEKALSSTVEEQFYGAFVRRVCGLQPYMDGVLQAGAEGVSDASNAMDDELAKNERGQTILSVALRSSVLVGGAILVAMQQIDFAVFIAYLMSSSRFHDLMMGVTGSLTQFNKSKVSLRTICMYLRAPISGALGSVSHQLPEAVDAIELQEISFSRPASGIGRPAMQILDSISFTIPQSAKCGIVGPSGCGKSTLLKILAQLYPNQNGTFLIGGLPAQSIDVAKTFSLLEQETLLFEGTVSFNVMIGEQEDIPNMSRALKDAAFTPYLRKLPYGVESDIGPKGKLLSGGMKQRLGLARAIFRIFAGRMVLVLDEPTSAQDPQSTREIGQNLAALPGKTVIAVTHTISLLQSFDWMVVMLGGEVAEHGSKEELYNKKGHWYRIARQEEGVKTDDKGAIEISPDALMAMWLFADPEISEEMLKPFVDFFIPRHCAVGDSLLTQGQPADTLFVVVSGMGKEIRRKGDTEDDEGQEVCTWTAGDVKGIDSLLSDDLINTTSVTVLNPMVLLTFPRRLFAIALRMEARTELGLIIERTKEAVELMRSPKFLETVWPLADLDADQLQAVSHRLQVVVYEAGATLCSNDPAAGTKSRAMMAYIVACGFLEAMEHSGLKDGGMMTNLIHAKGLVGCHVFAHLAKAHVSHEVHRGLDRQQTYRALHSLRCKTRCVLIEFDKTAMDRLNDEHPSIPESIAVLNADLAQALSPAELRRLWVFAVLPEDLLRELGQLFEVTGVGTGTVVLEEDAPSANRVHVVLRGAVEVVHPSAGVSTVQQGGIINQEALEKHLLGGTPASSSIGPNLPSLATVSGERNCVRAVLTLDSFIGAAEEYDAEHGTRQLEGLRTLMRGRDTLRTPAGLMKAVPGLQASEAAAYLQSSAIVCETVLKKGEILQGLSQPAHTVRSSPGEGFRAVHTVSSSPGEGFRAAHTVNSSPGEASGPLTR
ncbi:hypothetical protein CYMTET_32776, partial [Cymbomonas tetramitiformis]